MLISISRVALRLALLIALATSAAVVAGDRSAWAGECDDDDSEGGKFHIEERNGQKVYVIDKVITVCGKVPRPLVAYVLQARNINYQWESLKQDFLPKILQSVKKAPF